MTRDQSRKLKPGDRVRWADSATDHGTVLKTDWSGVRIEWDDGKNSFHAHNDMGAMASVIPG
jgi:hypothetical protein